MTANRGLVLLVEDDENDVFFFLRAFRKAGFENPVQAVRDGLEAVHYLTGHGEYADRSRFPLPVLVILDLNTPRRHGIEVLRWIRSQPRFARLIVVVMTSSSSETDLQAAYSLGTNSYLCKPADQVELQRTVESIATYWLGMNRVPPNAACGLDIEAAI